VTGAPVEILWYDVDGIGAPVLTVGEEQRAARMRSGSARRRFVARRTALRRYLGERLAVDPRSVTWSTGPHGKPALPPPHRLRFNVSSSGDWVVIAASEAGEVGVDVERIRDDLRRDAIARRFFTEREQRSAVTAEGFFAVWTLKEAVVKGTGLGLSHLPLGSFDVDAGAPDGVSALVACRSDPALVGAWRLAPVDAPEGYRAALATGS
jgi:4'-phosphopantetheinyl transferase